MELPRNLFWSIAFPCTRRVKFDKPVKLSAQVYEIEKNDGDIRNKIRSSRQF
mgnify:FL=1